MSSVGTAVYFKVKTAYKEKLFYKHLFTVPVVLFIFITSGIFIIKYFYEVCGKRSPVKLEVLD